MADEKRLPSQWAFAWRFWLTAFPLVLVPVGWYYYVTAEQGAEEFRSVLLVFAMVAVGVGGPIETLFCLHRGRILVKLQKAMDGGKAPVDLPPDQVRRVLTAYFPASILSLVHWVISAALWPAAVWSAGLDPFDPRVFYTAGAALCVGALSGVLTFYSFNTLIWKRLGPVLLREGTLAHLRPTIMVRSYHHIIALVATLGIVQPILVGLLVLGLPEVHLWNIVALAVMMLVVAAVQVGGILRSISGGVGHILERMREVRHGELETRAVVRVPDTFGELASDFNRMVEGLRQRELIRETFGRYVTQQVADEILAGRVALGGERRTATVLFSDIRGFTSMSEKLSPEEVVEFLNDYLNLMVECVLKHGGILDKFIGDAIMAVFGVPLGQGTVTDDAKAALRCALEMSERLDQLNQKREAANQAPIEIGIGVHTGDLVAGNIGSPVRMEYTVIGDTVNISSRLEGMTKTLKRRILLSANTAELVGDEIKVEELQSAQVKGRSGEVRIFTPTA